jgi:cystathionine beta-lyase
MKYDFDKVVNRKNTDCEKFDFAKDYGKPEDAIPMWVADMDFETLPEAAQAILKRAKHHIYGYSEPKEDYFLSVCKWFGKRFNFDLQPQNIVKTPGVIAAFCTAIKAFTKPNESVLICPPVYYPFARSVVLNNRKLINSELVYSNFKYSIDFADFQKKIVENNVKLFIFCSPHNPVGRVWSREELARIVEICAKHNVIIFSDEIHCDFVFRGYKHIPLANVAGEYKRNIVIATAPSKTFNLAGLKTSNIFIFDDRLKKLFNRELVASGLNMIGPFGIEACKAAYNFGEDWVDQLNAYIEKNLEFCAAYLLEKIPQIKLIRPQGTYLIWLDCKSLGIDEKKLDDFFANQAKIWVDDGQIFGQGGAGFVRINIATRLAVVKQAFGQLDEAVRGLL